MLIRVKENAINVETHRKLNNAKTRFVINRGGAGSGKSYAQTEHELKKLINGYEKTLVVRKFATSLNNSVVSLFKSVIKKYHLSDFYKENISLRQFQFNNGSEIIFTGLDDVEKIKSIAGITRIWIEEATEITRDDFNQLNLRLRGKDNLQITLTFNPVDEGHWIKSHFFDTPDVRENTTFIKTTYKDNKFIDEAYKQQLESYATIDKNYYKIYALGEWGGQVEGRIFQSWEEVDSFPEVDGFWFGLDFGYTNDPTAIVKVLRANDRIYADEICYQTGLTNSDIAGVFRSNGYRGQLVICDAAEPKSIEELRRLGINAVSANKGQGSILAGIDYLKRSKVIITKRSSNLRKENQYYSWQQTKDGRFINTPKDFQNHGMDALRYSISLNLPELEHRGKPLFTRT